MSKLTLEEYASLSRLDRLTYERECEYTDFAVKDGKLYIVSYPPPMISWQRLKELLNALEYRSFDAVPKGVIAVYGYADLGDDWNSCGMPYTQYGFEYSLNLGVWGCGEKYGYGKEGQHAQKPVLVDWLRAHGCTDEEIGGAVYWNWHGWSAKFRCRFTDCPPHYLPAKLIRWIKKHQEWKHKVFNQEQKGDNA